MPLVGDVDISHHGATDKCVKRAKFPNKDGSMRLCVFYMIDNEHVWSLIPCKSANDFRKLWDICLRNFMYYLCFEETAQSS